MASRECTAENSMTLPKKRGENVFELLRRREVDPSGSRRSSQAKCRTDNRKALSLWVESDSLRHCRASYCAINHPRSTIAAAFSPDGTLLASTHGDHTVKLICCRTGAFLKELEGHKRTPWVVRFHPRSSQILASGSLDHTVRLWNTSTAQCVAEYDFARPIASLAFHAYGNVLAVASGHKVWTWEYSKGASHPGGRPSAPTTALRTKRSLRAVHFHPHGNSLLLTAEVNDADATESNPPSQAITWLMNPASASGGAPAVAEMPQQQHRVGGGEGAFTPIGPPGAHVWMAPGNGAGAGAGSGAEWVAGRGAAAGPSNGPQPMESDGPEGSAEQMEMEPGGSGRGAGDGGGGGEGNEGAGALGGLVQVASNIAAAVAGSIAGAATGNGHRGGGGAQTPEATLQQQATAAANGGARGRGLFGAAAPAPPPAPTITGRGGGGGGAAAAAATVAAAAVAGGAAGGPAMAAAAAANNNAAAAAAIVGQEQPCTVKLRLWPFNEANPAAKLEHERLTIPHAVLCSEMGTHFSPCGRYLAACVACRPPPEAYPDDAGMASSLVYELRVYSLDQDTFGRVLVARAVRAAHCLTSIQFSPTSEHLLLAYGRRHISLLRSLVADGGAIVPVHTILEVYRVRDMQLVRVLPSAEDEVNVACFHPVTGGGLAYGTKEGRLRLLRHDRAPRKAGAGGGGAAGGRGGDSANGGHLLEDELLVTEGGGAAGGDGVLMMGE